MSDDAPPPPAAADAPAESCEFCGATALAWRKCKQVCLRCGNINRSCADL